MNFVCVKKHEQGFTLNFVFSMEFTLNFFMFKKGNRKTLNSLLVMVSKGIIQH